MDEVDFSDDDYIEPPLHERLRDIADDIFHGRFLDQGPVDTILEAARLIEKHVVVT